LSLQELAGVRRGPQERLRETACRKSRVGHGSSQGKVWGTS
jgi:hypothetical protein